MRGFHSFSLFFFGFVGNVEQLGIFQILCVRALLVNLGHWLSSPSCGLSFCLLSKMLKASERNYYTIEEFFPFE